MLPHSSWMRSHIWAMSLVVCGISSLMSNDPGLGGPHLLDDELIVVLIILDVPADFHETALGHGVEDVAGGVPHPGHHLAGAVGDVGLDEWLAFARGAELFAGDDEDVLDGVAGLHVTKEKSAHEKPALV